MLTALGALLQVLFWAGCVGVTVFGFVLGARAFDAHERGVSRVRRALSPEPCGFCGAHGGWHDQGCSRLDRLDASRWRA